MLSALTALVTALVLVHTAQEPAEAAQGLAATADLNGRNAPTSRTSSAANQHETGFRPLTLAEYSRRLTADR